MIWYNIIKLVASVFLFSILNLLPIGGQIEVGKYLMAMRFRK